MTFFHSRACDLQLEPLYISYPIILMPKKKKATKKKSVKRKTVKRAKATKKKKSSKKKR